MRTIAHISDLHFGRVDPATAAALVEDLAALSPSVLVVSGDFTQRARRREYSEAREYLGRLPRPQVLVPGNHDIPLYDVIRRFFFPLSRYRKYITSEMRPRFGDDELLVMGINSARSFTWKNGRISQEQLLDIRLHACPLPPGVFKVVVTHHPFIPPPGELKKGIIGRSAMALNEMEKCGVDMILSGHLHVGYSGDVRTHHEAVKRSILSVQAGTAISTRRRNEPNAYNLITINSDHVTIAVRACSGGRFRQTEVTHYSKIDHAWV
ncbi:MAG TPA: metallophosphoesterase [Tepidisphaeraceae bacterium]|jgi:3',5'-cyclic AMP phosphodiesterase CpdA